MGRPKFTAEEKAEAKKNRHDCTLDPVTWKRVKKLAKGKWYGATAAKVMTHFIEEGVRQAREKGYLTLKD